MRTHQVKVNSLTLGIIVARSYSMSFTANDNKGFRLTFSNGITISVQFGPYNYCERTVTNPDAKQLEHDAPLKERSWRSKDAEIAVWCGADRANWWNFDANKWGESGSDVQGYCSADEVADYIKFFKNMNLSIHKLLIAPLKERTLNEK